MVIKDYFITTLDKNKYPNHPIVDAIGYEKRLKTDELNYVWDCKKSKESVCVFQYTMSGKGVLQINEKKYVQKAGDVFLIERPGNYKYWLPEDSDCWEFKFLSISFSAIPFWSPIVNNYGHTFNIKDENNPVMRQWNKLFDLVEKSTTTTKINDTEILNVQPFDTFLDNSLYAYKFLTVLHKYLFINGQTSSNAESVLLCIEFINTNFSREITNYDIAQAGFISPYYLNSKFKDAVGMTPLQYLTKVRLQNAMAMLYNLDYTIDFVAKQCGFKNANYFTKVYKKYTNLTPSEFRTQKRSMILL
ncbi:MAG: helix-turn-helix domain-containing protein [Ruminococcaceae bacterium]|nr:helix-turn-helix domain-containing protein [Oscillospiraceae bacterium]